MAFFSSTARVCIVSRRMRCHPRRFTAYAAGNPNVAGATVKAFPASGQGGGNSGAVTGTVRPYTLQITRVLG